ncbi:GNAT family N-acetyltransferase [Halobacillus litoralis]|uniref:GNAT family N-acetyltransferase n=1 Tax=Halobacillus litoralis TaxID=45668 RepID=A0A410MHZ3_9BACI|nr:GNAT family N-acetyltransferase [Halobacillus litoralis]QAS54310.1 GNAT family N-acetyltransferase [Halobacillus litoralis]
MLTYRTIDLEKDQGEIVEFRKDSFMTSFGDISGFHKSNYLTYVEKMKEAFGDGFVMAEEDGRTVGQLELSVKRYEGRVIGYIHLFYLVAEKRGKGYSGALQSYAMDFFRKYRVGEYHLRVAPANRRARQFYKKNGMVDIGPELDGKVIRMKGTI